MKVLVTGSRDWSNASAIEREFKKLPPGTIIIHGDCPTGADAIADKLAKKYGFKIRRYPANWDAERDSAGGIRSAGPKRNARMIKEEHPDREGTPIDMGLAFTLDLSRSRGTKNCVERARAAGIKVEVHAS